MDAKSKKQNLRKKSQQTKNNDAHDQKNSRNHNSKTRLEISEATGQRRTTTAKTTAETTGKLGKKVTKKFQANSIKTSSSKTSSSKSNSIQSPPTSPEESPLSFDRHLNGEDFSPTQENDSSLNSGFRNGQVVRIYRVLTLLENSRFGLTAKDIKKMISNNGTPISERTIYRDLEVLRSSGFPLEETKVEKNASSKWRVIRKHENAVVRLTINEVFSLFLAQNYLRFLEKTPFYPRISSVFNKLMQNVSTESSKALIAMAEELNFESGSLHALGIDDGCLMKLRLALGERQFVTFDYLTPGGMRTKRKCGPQFLYFAKGGLYLIAKDTGDGQMKTFALPRLENAEMLDEHYDEPLLAAKEYFKYCFGVYRAAEPEKIVLRFSPQIAGFVRERQWHHSQLNKILPNGELVVEFFVGVTPELTQWVLGFGSRVYVESPASLKELIAHEIHQIQKK